MVKTIKTSKGVARAGVASVKADKRGKIILEPRRKFDYSPDSSIFYDMIIIGAGVAGFSTAMYAGRLGLKVLVVGELKGGTITLTESVENFPGFISIDGGELGRLMENHAKDYDIDVLEGRADRVEMHREKVADGRLRVADGKAGPRRHFEVFSGDRKFFSKTLVIATGTRVRKLGIPGEKEFENKGVSYCALCDGPLFRGKVIGVVGGGNSAVKEALLLAEYGSKVYIICRGDGVLAERQNTLRLDEAVKAGKIEVITNTNVLEIRGNEFQEQVGGRRSEVGGHDSGKPEVEGGRIGSVVFDKAWQGKKELALGGLFVYIGSIPLNQFAKDLKVKMNRKGEVVINRNSETNILGLYAAGDITDSDWKQAITGVSEGVKAGYYAYGYVGDGRWVLELRK
jgi:thioredoxin reductase